MLVFLLFPDLSWVQSTLNTTATGGAIIGTSTLQVYHTQTRKKSLFEKKNVYTAGILKRLSAAYLNPKP